MRAHGYTVTRGFVYYVESKKRVEVILDDALVARTLALRDGALEAMQSDTPPPPLVGSSKCIRCSLAPLCLPDETNTLAGRDTDEPRRLVPTRDDALPLYVIGQGATVGLSGERLVVRLSRETKPAEEIRLIDVSDVSVFGAVSVTTPAIRTCVEQGFPFPSSRRGAGTTPQPSVFITRM